MSNHLSYGDKHLLTQIAAVALIILPVAAQQIDPEILAVKPFVDNWRACAMSKGARYSRSFESAETIAQTALAACGEEKRDVWEILLQSKGRAQQAEQDVEFLEKEIQQQIMITVLEARSAR